MDYNKIYESLILKAKNRVSLEGYSEKHHILPKSLGGSNNKDNIVRLTAREHLLAHKLLYLTTTGSAKIKMATAYHFMFHSNNPSRDYSSRDLAKAREIYSRAKKGVPSPLKGLKIDLPESSRRAIGKGKLKRIGCKIYYNQEGDMVREKPTSSNIINNNLYTKLNCTYKTLSKSFHQIKGTKIAVNASTGNYERIPQEQPFCDNFKPIPKSYNHIDTKGLVARRVKVSNKLATKFGKMTEHEFKEYIENIPTNHKGRDTEICIRHRKLYQEANNNEISLT